jgi:hypothetical protein
LARNAAKARRNEGFKDDNYLRKPRMVPINDQQKKEAEDEKQLDAYLDNMYKEMKTQSQKGGARKRSTRRNKRSTRRRNKRSRKSRRNKRSRKGRK